MTGLFIICFCFFNLHTTDNCSIERCFSDLRNAFLLGLNIYFSALLGSGSEYIEVRLAVHLIAHFDECCLVLTSLRGCNCFKINTPYCFSPLNPGLSHHLEREKMNCHCY